MSRFIALLVLAVIPLVAYADGDPNAISFEKHVLPILKESCHRCHDAKKGTADFRIDVRSRAKQGGESKKAGIVPGKAAESELFRRIASTDDETVMPPKKPLAKEKIEIIKKWIDGGAVWPDSLANETSAKHWAFESPKRPAVPKNASHPIDAFVLAKLATEGLKPSPAADKATLIRRLYLDLVGLPPTPKQVDAFLSDASPNAYAKVVDELLASPHYGERWGRLWLDAARYADSDGYEKDKPRFVHFYRDYVINAFNKDLPYNQFLLEQLAGDLLPNATQDQIVATGFLRNSMINEEGGIDPEQFRMEAMFDRMDAVGKGMLGLTIQCAQCHTHKYDPLTQAEYYKLFAYLNNSHEANVTVYTPDEQMKRSEIFQKIKQIEADLKHKTPDWEKKLAAWKAKLARPAWDVIRPSLDTSGGQKHTLLADGSIFASGYAPTQHTTDFSGPTKLKTLTAARLELLNDPNLPRGGPGRSIFGLFALTEFKLEVNGKAVKIASATADANGAEKPLDPIFDNRSKRNRITGPIAFAIDGNNDTAWSPDIGGGRSNVPRNAVFVFEKPVDLPENAKITIRLVQNHGGWNSDDNQNNNLGRFRLSVTDAPNPTADPLYGTANDFSVFRSTVPEWKDANAKIEAIWKEHPAGTSQLVYTERTEERPTFVLKRGDFLKPGEKTSIGLPTFLNAPAADLPPNRVGLAKWMTDRNAPTTARAFVNRVWQAYFGTGIVATPEDFGKMADPPSHPELLDWLAVEFMQPTITGAKPTDDRPWAVKRLHKLIVTSATYQQTSKVSPELAAKDPANRLLARGPRFRVDGELVRDIALSVSGLLNPKVGGPSVYPPIPQFLTQPPASYGPKVWPESVGPDRYRRSLYVFRFRSIPYPALQAFDSPTGDFACVKRSRSNTPIQALTAMNEPIFVEASQAFGLRILKDGGETDRERIAFAFRLCTARSPSEAETAILLDLLTKNVAKYSDPKADPWAVAVSKPEDARKLPNGATPAQLAAWVTVGRVLLNLDETMTKE
ncbi:MAG: PSD1 domain-containing protein [Gemmataceae bacterium]|nr:PSD1 domain-containing protein [Gemmataceae bacterium]